MMKSLEGKAISLGIIQGLDFSLRQGEVIALMGPNGAGKSTLARLLAGLNEPTSGKLNLLEGGQEIPWTRVRRWQEIGIIGQHPRRQTIGATVGEELGFGLLNLGYEMKKVQDMVGELAYRMGLEGKLHQSPATLSGGERQRLVLGAILALNPAFLLLDEALSMLDRRAQEACLELLEEKGKHMGQLWITHDPLLAKKADRLWVMKEGKLSTMGRPQTALRDERFCQEYGIRAPYSPSYSPGYSSVREKMGEKYQKVQNLRYPEGFSAATGSETESPFLHGDERKDTLEWREAEYGQRLQLTEKIKEGCFLAVLGPSGAGKSTLLESAVGLIHPSRGKFLAFGQEVTRQTKQRQKARLLLQEPGEYIIGGTVYDEVFYLQNKKERKAGAQRNAEYLRVFGIPPEKALAYPEYLSGGERQRVALAAALESLPEILLLDEPLLGLDLVGRSMVLDLLQELKGRMTILYITHDWSEVRELADEVWLVEKGRITFKQRSKDGAMEIDDQQLKEAGVHC
ncbi:ABC transporter ATP-binding protein [Desulfitobacterium hafniense]|uniref:ABC transporter ATP-binding protein n=1 Tax=Desulfitobacterium hafniense TaxID=49338 RepID=UPI0003821800|nr:ATP-binding cassette domain-containing protein [Desulfitobacterium hafniense]